MLRDYVAADLEAGEVQVRNFETMLHSSNGNRQYTSQCSALVEITNIQQPLSNRSQANQNKPESKGYNPGSELVMSVVEELQNVPSASEAFS